MLAQLYTLCSYNEDTNCTVSTHVHCSYKYIFVNTLLTIYVVSRIGNHVCKRSLKNAYSIFIRQREEGEGVNVDFRPTFVRLMLYCAKEKKKNFCM